jgi:hypothetical protein
MNQTKLKSYEVELSIVPNIIDVYNVSAESEEEAKNLVQKLVKQDFNIQETITIRSVKEIV